MKSFEDYRRRIPALSDKNTIRIMKRGATNTKRILGLGQKTTAYLMRCFISGISKSGGLHAFTCMVASFISLGFSLFFSG